MNVQRLAAFSDGVSGGNPAGVCITNALPSASEMQKIAAEVGYSETAFASPLKNGWRVRYFAPESEVPFCGHATIALGAALASQEGDGVFSLQLNEASITVEGKKAGENIFAALQSPPTYSEPVSAEFKAALLTLFNYREDQLDTRLPVAMAHGGANHIVMLLDTREALAAMEYDLASGRRLMNEAGLITVLLGYAETPQLFHTRNPFASGGVYEDPATGAATAALAGYLRDVNWPHNNKVQVIQGEDMGSRSLLEAEFTDETGSSIRVSGAARFITD